VAIFARSQVEGRIELEGFFELLAAQYLAAGDAVAEGQVF
jgi:hypothetical protein